MKKPIEILVACGSGIASSSVAAEAVKKIMKDADIPANVHKGTVQTIAQRAPEMDIIMTTSNFKRDIGVPVIKVFPLISGVGKAKCEQLIKDTATEIYSKRTDD
ncbi:MAG: hypothetical protein ACOX6E_09995 [Syntrophomonadaceae bacterium]